MKLSHLTLTSFRSFVGMELPLDAPRVLIAGLNGSGKTTVANAIRWALTGHCDGTDARGAGAEILIPDGAQRAEVGLALDGIGTLTRSYAEHGGGTFAVDAFTGTSQIQQQALYIKLNTTPEFLDAVLDTGIFLDLNHVAAKALVLSLLGVKVQPYGAEGPSWTLDELDQRYKQAFEERKVAKKVLAGMTVPPPPTGQMPSVQAIEDQLAKLRTSLGALREAVGSIAGRRKALEQERNRQSAQPEDGPPDDVSEKIAELQAKLTELEAAAVPAVDAVAPAKGDPQRLTFLRSSVEMIQRHLPKNGCVLDREIPCKTAAAAFTDRLKVLTDELKALDPKPAAAQQAESPLTVARRQLRAFEQQQAERFAELARREEAARRVAAIEQELAGLAITATQDAEIQTLEGRITKGEQLLKDARAHWAAVEAAKTAAAARQAQEAEVARLEALVEELGPNGVRVQALADALGRFEAAVNPYIEPFGWRVSFKVEPWEVFVNGRPAESYSRSERYRIGIALQMGIAMLSGLKFAVIDEMDMLDVANRGLVTKMLLQAPLDQILILGTREAAQALPTVPGVLCYRLVKQGDRSDVAERTAAA